jgi:hypothetical protein
MSLMDEEGFTPPSRRPNPVTRAAFRRQVWRQIYLPFFLGALVIGSVAALLWTRGLALPSAWADASLILLLLPTLVLALVPIVVLGVLSYGVVYLIQRIPGPAHEAQRAVARVRRTARQGAGIAVEPILVARSAQAVVEAVGQRLLTVLRGKEKSNR